MTDKQRRKAFWDDLKALEVKHGFRLQAYSLAPKFQLAPIIKPVADEMREAAEKLAGTRKPWYKRLLNS